VLEKARNILILSSSGGGGLLQAAIAKEQEIQKRNPSAILSRRDMMKDWYWKSVGKFGMRKWDEAQRAGDVKTLERLIGQQKYGDVIFWPWVFYRALKTFFKEEVDHVIDTQPLGTSAILLALRIYNHRRGKNVVLEKIVVDLPTKLNTHFFRPVKMLSKRNKKQLRLVTIPPLPDHSEQSVEEFWHKHCRLSEKEVVYEYYPVRQSFRSYQEKQLEKSDFSIKAHFSNAEESRLLSEALQNGSIKTEIDEHSVEFTIAPQDRVVTLLLGSQPAYEATLGYVRQIQQTVQKMEGFKGALHLFVLCAQHRPGEDSLLKRVSELAASLGCLKMHVIPLSFQPDAVIAPLFHRSDLTCTRSGGQTVMELMCTTKGEIWIHSESKKASGLKDDLTLEELLKGIPGWEAGNALYMRQFYNAKVVTPEHCGPLAKDALQRWMNG
jgi:UDP-N-acetylglucosamine:LPS N-acetylglucosamine transferase